MPVTKLIKSSTVSDGDYIIDIGLPPSSKGVCSITFYDADGNAVTPTAGTFQFLGTDDGYCYSSIVAEPYAYRSTAQSITTDDGYARPNFCSAYITKVKVNLQGITGATQFTARVHFIEEK